MKAHQVKLSLLTLLILTLWINPSLAQTNYYIDPINGNDTNSGSLAAPWQSFRNINTYYNSSFRPAQWVDLNPGDTLYLMDGIHNTITHPGDDSGAFGGGSQLIYFRGKHGSNKARFSIKAFPKTNPILDPGGLGIGIQVLQSSYFDITGITVRNAYAASEGGGIKLAEASNILVDEVEIYDTDGIDNNNVSGLHCAGCSGIEIRNSSFYDNYDRTNDDTGGLSTPNSSNMVFFRGEDILIYNNLFYHSVPITADKSGTCLKYKHASSNPNAYFHVYNNFFENCKHGSIQTGTANTHFHHNIILNSDRVHSKDLGGPTHQTNQVFEYNTLYNSGGILVNPTITWRNADFPNDPQNIVIRNNIIFDNSPNYNQENGIINVGTYMSDELYNHIFPELQITNNCYYNPNTSVNLNIGASNGGNYGVLGNQYTLTMWQQDLGYDSGSVEVNPMLIDPDNGNFQPITHSPCATMGALPAYSDLIFQNAFES